MDSFRLWVWGRLGISGLEGIRGFVGYLLIAVGFSQLSTIPQLLFEPALGVYPVISRWMPIVLDGKYAVSML